MYLEKRSSTAHEFALYTEALASLGRLTVGQLFTVTDKALAHRVLTVLRLEEGESCILFDSSKVLKVRLVRENSNKSSEIAFAIEEIQQHTPLKPAVHWLLPLLKRDAFEEALYSLVELGVTSIIPFTATKTGRLWLGQKELVRCRALMIAAAEQSKNFLIPTLHPVAPFIECLSQWSSQSSFPLFLDAAGQKASDCLKILSVQAPASLLVCSGPEGDLTTHEKQLLADHTFMFMALTPTILRAQQAVAVGMGIIRSVLRQ